MIHGDRIDQAIYKLSFRPKGRILAATHFGIQELDYAGQSIQAVGEPLADSGVSNLMVATAYLVIGLNEEPDSSQAEARLWDAESHRAFPLILGSKADPNRPACGDF
jgi:hypothetical protein